jgi:hypothetical protein
MPISSNGKKCREDRKKEINTGVNKEREKKEKMLNFLVWFLFSIRSYNEL